MTNDPPRLPSYQEWKSGINPSDHDEKIIAFSKGHLRRPDRKWDWLWYPVGELILTRKFVIFLSAGNFKPMRNPIFLKQITEIKWAPSIFFYKIKIKTREEEIIFVSEKTEDTSSLYEKLKTLHASRGLSPEPEVAEKTMAHNDLELSLDSLTRLRDGGYITLAEFTQKRAEILNRLVPSDKPPSSLPPSDPELPLLPSASNGYQRTHPGLKDRKPKVWIAAPRAWIVSP